MLQCQRCGNILQNGETRCQRCGAIYQGQQSPYEPKPMEPSPTAYSMAQPAQNTSPKDLDSESTRFRYNLAAKIDTYGLLWKVIGMLQMILIVVSLVTVLATSISKVSELNDTRSTLRYYGGDDSTIQATISELEQAIVGIVIAAVLIVIIGWTNYRSGSKIMKDSNLAISNPACLMEQFFQLKSMIKALLFNVLISGLMGTDIGSATMSIGLLGLFGSIYGFYVRYYLLANAYQFSQANAYTMSPTANRPLMPQYPRR